MQKISWPKSIQILICKENFLTKDSIRALKKMEVKIIYTNFNKDWERLITKN